MCSRNVGPPRWSSYFVKVDFSLIPLEEWLLVVSMLMILFQGVANLRLLTLLGYTHTQPSPRCRKRQICDNQWSAFELVRNLRQTGHSSSTKRDSSSSCLVGFRSKSWKIWNRSLNWRSNSLQECILECLSHCSRQDHHHHPQHKPLYQFFRWTASKASSPDPDPSQQQHGTICSAA